LPVFTALFDANVLYSIVITDIVMELASTGLFRARWSDHIHEEWIRNVVKNRPDIPPEAIERRRSSMDTHFPDALVTGYQPLIDSLALPDPDDRHVLAAAISGRADVVVTLNLADFPLAALAPYELEAQHPDEFLNHQRTLDESNFLTCIKAIRARLKNPKYSAEGYIDHLRVSGLQVVAAELMRAKALI
jgi:predicted nucleic acid-binding protein